MKETWRVSVDVMKLYDSAPRHWRDRMKVDTWALQDWLDEISGNS